MTCDYLSTNKLDKSSGKNEPCLLSNITNLDQDISQNNNISNSSLSILMDPAKDLIYKLDKFEVSKRSLNKKLVPIIKLNNKHLKKQFD